MKIRIKGDSLRLRLTQSEVKSFEDTGRISDTIHFPGSKQLEYALTLSDHNEFDAVFMNDLIEIRVPRANAQDWFHPDEVGISAQLKLDQDNELKLLIEKDFTCLTSRPDEDESDQFPNPLLSTNKT